MKNLRRDNQLHFMVNDNEREVINKKMAILGITNMAEYLRRMAIYGYMIEVDMQPFINILNTSIKVQKNLKVKYL